MAFSIVTFLACSMVCFAILLLRRKFVGAELGGPKNSRNLSAVVCVLLWLLYVTLNTLGAYEIINMDLGTDKGEFP